MFVSSSHLHLWSSGTKLIAGRPATGVRRFNDERTLTDGRTQRTLTRAQVGQAKAWMRHRLHESKRAVRTQNAIFICSELRTHSRVCINYTESKSAMSTLITSGQRPLPEETFWNPPSHCHQLGHRTHFVRALASASPVRPSNQRTHAYWASPPGSSYLTAPV